MIARFVRYIATPLVHNSKTGEWTRNGKVVLTDAQFANAQAAFAFVLFVVFPLVAIVVAEIALWPF